MTPIFINVLMTSVALTAIFCASSPTVMASVIATSRTTRAVGISKPCFASVSAAIARFLLLVARAHVADDVQLLAPVAGRLVVDRIARCLGGLRGRRRRRLALALALLARLHFGLAPRLFLGAALAVLFIAAPPVLLLETLAVEALFLRALELGLCLLLGLALAIELLLLMARLILEHLALYVGALAAHFDIDGARPPLGTCELQLRLRLALQGDFARRGIGVPVTAAVTAPQMGEQLVLRILRDHVLGAHDLDPRLIELLQEPVDRHLQHFRELRDCYICHTACS